MNRKRKRRWTIIVDLLLLSLIVPALYVLSFGKTLLQEKDTFPVIWASVRLEVNRSNLEPVGSSGQRWLIRNTKLAPADKKYAPLEDYLKQQGWIRKYQKSSVGIYQRKGERIYVNFKPYTSSYIICQGDLESHTRPKS